MAEHIRHRGEMGVIMVEHHYATKKQRGGKRQGAGRPSALGETVRRDLRVPDYIEREAIRVGKGEFAKGMRLMCDEYMKMRERDTQAEPPKPGDLVLIWLESEERWAIAQATESADGIAFCELGGQPDTLHAAETWRPLPAETA